MKGGYWRGRWVALIPSLATELNFCKERWWSRHGCEITPPRPAKEPPACPPLLQVKSTTELFSPRLSLRPSVVHASRVSSNSRGTERLFGHGRLLMDRHEGHSGLIQLARWRAKSPSL
ncbi:hypothetical protein E2C01_098064 [Portunus trituberculatus]|uniref:Uncharacterized protein n=1 Tax=Portunus trituberculatus TaxID=210409 RepID=A0A5B7K7E3_PORTR|nr:hypothetical protein [Portunus trituberculatus]